MRNWLAANDTPNIHGLLLESSLPKRRFFLSPCLSAWTRESKLGRIVEHLSTELRDGITAARGIGGQRDIPEQRRHLEVEAGRNEPGFCL